MTLEREQTTSCRNTYTPLHIVCYIRPLNIAFNFLFYFILMW